MALAEDMSLEEVFGIVDQSERVMPIEEFGPSIPGPRLASVSHFGCHPF